jgi:hypothetical protein
LPERKLCAICYRAFKREYYHRVQKYRKRKPRTDLDRTKDRMRYNKWKQKIGSKEKRHQCYLKSKAKLKINVFTKLGMQCKCCLSTDMKFFTVDHVHGGGNLDRQKRAHDTLYRQILLMDENEMRENYQTLCIKCNWGKWRYGECPCKESRDSEGCRGPF